MNPIQILTGLFLAASSLALLVFTLGQWKKTKIVSSLSIQCSSGDSEVMSFNHNFLEGESQDSKDSKIKEAFDYIQERRDENHEKYLKIKADAIEENLAKDPKDLKLRPVAETAGQ